MEAHDFSGERVHLSFPPVPGDPLPNLRCDRCKQDLPSNNFAVLGHTDKVAEIRSKFANAMIQHSVCINCRRQERGKWTAHPLYSPQLDRYWQKATNSLRGGAKSRGILFGVDKDDLLGLYLDSGGICALTGLETDWRAKGHKGRNGKNYRAPSVDRVDSNGNYVLGNLQIVMRIVNIMKHDLPNDQFLELCRRIAEHNMFR